MLMMRARVQGHRWVDHPAAAVMEARVPGQWVDRPAAVVMEAREQGRCWIDHPAAAVMEARVQGRHWVDRPSYLLPATVRAGYKQGSVQRTGWSGQALVVIRLTLLVLCWCGLIGWHHLKADSTPSPF
ncbi:hypothetical protein ACOMHN_052967 [Nucella lapillus]